MLLSDAVKHHLWQFIGGYRCSKIKPSSIKLYLVWTIKGVEKKTWTFVNNSDETVSLATNMLESWYIFHLEGRIHSSVWSTETFLYNIREIRYKQNNMRNQISRSWNNEQSMLNSSSYDHFRRLVHIPF